jgi:hypothetical protein
VAVNEYCIYCGKRRYVLGEEPVAVTAQFGPLPIKNYFQK